MTTAEIESAIIDRLKEQITGLRIEGFPDKPAEYQFNHPVGAILVHYQGSEFSPPLGRELVQARKIEIALTVMSRNLRTHTGVYGYLDAVRAALTGFTIAGCTPMTPVKEEFLSESNGVWQYQAIFAMTAP